MRYLIITLFLALMVSYTSTAYQTEEEPAVNDTASFDSEADTTGLDATGYDLWDPVTGPIIKESTIPTLEVMWSMNSRPSIRRSIYGGNFAEGAAAEFRIGFTSLSPVGSCSNECNGTHEHSNLDHLNHAENLAESGIYEFSYNYFFLGNMANTWSISEKQVSGTLPVSAEFWRFGFNSSDGFTYSLGNNSDITLYNTDGIGWTKIDFSDTITNLPQNDVIRTYGDAFRFGTQFEGGIKIKLFSPIAISAGYERQIVFPRHMFWYWAASEITEGLGEGLIDMFVDEVLDRVPTAAPVVNFVLKNAFSFGMYELRRKHMNWPVLTTAPIMFENYKLGLTVSF